MCTDLVACGNLSTSRMTQAECEASCNAQDELYNIWTDQEKRDAFDEEMRCLGASTCDEIAAGACYDETAWSY